MKKLLFDDHKIEDGKEGQIYGRLFTLYIKIEHFGGNHDFAYFRCINLSEQKIFRMVEKHPVAGDICYFASAGADTGFMECDSYSDSADCGHKRRYIWE